MDMYTFHKSMALFWTLAEGLILIYIRWGFMFLIKRKGREKIFLISCVTIFGLLIFLMYGGEIFFGKFMDLRRGTNLHIYRWALWNFFCTLWVVLEGIIMIYVLRIYKALRSPLQKKVLKREKSNFPYGILILIFSFFTLYVFYQYNLLSIINKNLLDARGIVHISTFYIRICGLFWILFEWIVAFIGIKTYFVLKRTEGRIL